MPMVARVFNCVDAVDVDRHTFSKISTHVGVGGTKRESNRTEARPSRASTVHVVQAVRTDINVVNTTEALCESSLGDCLEQMS